MAILGRWTGSSVSLFPTTSWAAPNGAFPTQQRNDSSTYSFTSSTSTLTLPSSDLADGYLIIARTHVDCSHNNRNTISTKIVQASGTGNFIGSPTAAYSRNSNNDENFNSCFAFVDNPSASATFQFQWKREVGDGTPAGQITASSIDVIPFYYSDIGIYQSTTSGLYGGTTPNQVTLSSTVLEGTNITRTGNVVTVTGDNKRYFIISSQYDEGRGNARTQRWIGHRYDGTKDDAAKAYFFSRDSGTDFAGNHVHDIIETVTASRTIDLFCYRGDGVSNNQGGADVDGSTPSTSDHSLVVIELNDNAEVIRSTNASASSQSINGTTPVDISGVNTVTFNDSASFTKTSATQANVEQAMDALCGANIGGASDDVTSGTRYEGVGKLAKNGTEDSDVIHGNYNRNNQSSTDTFGWSANPIGFVGLASGDDIGFSAFRNGGDAGPCTVQAGWTGFWAINLDTLEESASTSPITSNVNTSSSTVSVLTGLQTGVLAGSTDALGAELYTESDAADLNNEGNSTGSNWDDDGVGYSGTFESVTDSNVGTYALKYTATEVSWYRRRLEFTGLTNGADIELKYHTKIGTTGDLGFVFVDGFTDNNLTSPTTSWASLSYTKTLTGTSFNLKIYPTDGDVGAIGDEIFVDGISVREAAVPAGSTTSGNLTVQNSPITASINPDSTVTGDLDGEGKLIVVVSTVTSTVSDLTSGVTIEPIASNVNTSSTTVSVLSGKASLVSSINTVTSTVSVLSANGSLEVVVNGDTTTSSILNALGVVQATINPATTESGVLLARGSLEGVSNVDSSLSGLLNSNLQGSSDTDTTTNTVAVLTATGDLESQASTLTTTTGTLISTFEIESSINTLSTTSGVLTATGLLNTSVSTDTQTVSVLTSEGQLISNVSTVTTTTGVLTSDGILEGTVTSVASISGILNSNLQASVDIDTTTNTQATLTGNGQLISEIDPSSIVIGSLSSDLNAESSINVDSTTSGTLTAKGELNANITTSSSLDGILDSDTALFGVITTQTTTVSVLVAKGQMTSVVSTNSNLSGLLNSNLQGSVNVDTTTGTTAVLTGTGELESGINVDSIVLGLIEASASLVAEVNTLSSTVSVLIANGALNSSITTDSSLSGSLASNISLAGTSDTDSELFGVLTAKGQLESTVNASSTTSGLLNSNLQGSVIVDTDTFTNATLTAVGYILSTILTESTVSGQLFQKIDIQGNIDADSQLTGLLTINVGAEASIDTDTTITATLTGSGQLLVVINTESSLEGDIYRKLFIFGVVNSSSSTQGSIIYSLDLRKFCVYDVVYVDRIYDVIYREQTKEVEHKESEIFIVNYIETTYEVNYVDKIYLVNYKCKT